MRQGPLSGMKVVELVGLGPGPFAAMMLSDLGASVIRIDRADRVRPETHALKDALGEKQYDLLARGRPSVGVNLKHADGVACVLELVAQADALIEGFRPGVMERLGLGPDACLAANPRLVYGRMTGYGQTGPLKDRAGHDIDYIALSGALSAIGRAGEAPVAPLNLVGDFGGGATLLAFGVLAALFERTRSGLGQVVDASMVDGSALLMTMDHGFRAAGMLRERGTNLLDGGAHFYETYQTADGKHLAVGAIEPQFYAELIDKLGLRSESLPHQMDRSSWPAMKSRFAATFRQKTRGEWEQVFDGSDACVAPVLDASEVAAHPHNRARGTFVEIAGVVQPAPAPRFARTPTALPGPPAAPGADTERALAAWGLSAARIAELRAAGAIA
jgi:alpha-methylacyl-CoA racemase